MQNVLIAGGRGLIGERLTTLLLKAGYSVSILTRGKTISTNEHLKHYHWNPKETNLPIEAILEADHIVNLAGANVSGHRWTPSYKKELLDSRIEATCLIVSELNKGNHNVKTLINGSAVGYYGYDRHGRLTEESTPGNGFLAELCIKWEAEANKLLHGTTRLVISRTGIVLSPHGGALKPLADTIRYYIGAALGKGSQLMPWIHIDDLCRAFMRFMENESCNGVYNLTNPLPVSNTGLTQSIAAILHKPLFLPNIPAFMLKLVLGEAAEAVLGNLEVYPAKLLKEGFEYKFGDFKSALADSLNL